MLKLNWNAEILKDSYQVSADTEFGTLTLRSVDGALVADVPWRLFPFQIKVSETKDESSGSKPLADFHNAVVLLEGEFFSHRHALTTRQPGLVYVRADAPNNEPERWIFDTPFGQCSYVLRRLKKKELKSWLVRTRQELQLRDVFTLQELVTPFGSMVEGRSTEEARFLRGFECVIAEQEMAAQIHSKILAFVEANVPPAKFGVQATPCL